MTAIRIPIIGIDAALRNMGFARGNVCLHQGRPVIEITGLVLSQTQPDEKKTVRVSSSNLRCGQELHAVVQSLAATAQYVFAEIPTGAKSAKAAHGLGIAVGIMSSVPRGKMIEVSPAEVKAAVIGRRTGQSATKEDIIRWAVARWPAAPWIRRKVKGKANEVAPENEHLADACAAIVAGVSTPEFQRIINALMPAGGATMRRRVLV